MLNESVNSVVSTLESNINSMNQLIQGNKESMSSARQSQQMLNEAQQSLIDNSYEAVLQIS